MNILSALKIDFVACFREHLNLREIYGILLYTSIYKCQHRVIYAIYCIFVIVLYSPCGEV